MAPWFFRSATPCGLASTFRWAFPETRHGFRAPGRHLMPHPCSRHPLSTRFTQRAVVFAIVWLPARSRSQTRHRPGLSVRGGPMRVDGATNPELIHQYVQGLTLSRMPFGTPWRRVGITNPMVVEMHRWDGSHVSFLRKTELANAEALAGKTLGRYRTSVVACGDRVF